MSPTSLANSTGSRGRLTRFLAIALKISVTVFSIGPEFTVVAIRKRFRHFYGIFLSFYAESVAQNTKLRPETSGGLEVLN